MTLHQLNTLLPDAARQAFLDCCGSNAWATAMTSRRPYRNFTDLQRSAQELWRSLPPASWLEAFAAHPKIGEQKSSAKWSAAEQSGMSQANSETASSIAQLNQQYQRKFGWIFIVCATGKSAEELRHILQSRLLNSPAIELPLAAAEQLKITNLRLAKLIAE